MTTEEKLISLQTIGKLLEANYPYTRTGIDGTPVPPTIAKSIIDSSDRLILQAKLVEIVKSLDPNGSPKKSLGDGGTSINADMSHITGTANSTGKNGFIPA